MKKYLKFAIIFSAIYLGLILLTYLLSLLIKVFIPDMRNLSGMPLEVMGLFQTIVAMPVMVLSLFGLIAGTYIVPSQYCNVGFIGCDGLIGGIATIVLNAIFYFIVGAVIGKIFEGIKINKKVLIIIFISIAVIVFGFIFYKLFTPFKPNQNIQTNKNQVENNQTSDWKTFAGDNFEVKFPQDWNTGNFYSYNPKNVSFYKSFQDKYNYQCSISISYSILSSSGNFNTYVDNYVKGLNTGWQKGLETINGKTFVTEKNNTVPGTVHYFLNGDNNYIYTIISGAQYSDLYNMPEGPREFYVKQCDDIFKQMLSTFKFTEPKFEIKGFGLKFKITDDIKDLVYIQTGSGQDEPDFQAIRFSSESLNNAGGYCVPAEAPLGTLVIKHSAPVNGSYYYNRTPLLQDGNDYVYFDTPQATCSDIKSVQDLQTKQWQSLQQALKTIAKTSEQKTSNQNIPITDETIINAASNYYCGKGGDRPVVKNTNGTYVFDCTSEFTASDGSIIKDYQTSTVKKILRGDLNGDGREDAVVLTHDCGATCYDGLKIFLNNKNGVLSVDASSVSLSKGITVGLIGNQIEIKTFNLDDSLQMDQMYEVQNNKLVPVVGG